VPERSSPEWLRISDEVREARSAGRAVVALESTVIAQGLPRPQNLETALALEAAIRAAGATPATVAMLDGRPTVGLTEAELTRIATDPDAGKVSTRDLPLAMAGECTGGTTVAATARLASLAGIEVFATGGIGGVHRGLPPDVSSDLTELQRTRILVTCAGAKSILDLPATRELLETLGILVLGWRTESFPAFYTPGSGLGVDGVVRSAGEVARVWRAHGRLGAESAVLLCAPVPAEHALPEHLVERVIGEALDRAAREGIRGARVTPFLLSAIHTATGGASLRANVALLRNNAEVAAEVATELVR
jgi:pseudouridylate synthase